MDRGKNSLLGTTQTGYGTTPVGCRGGSRYVEGVPQCFLEISKIQKFDLPNIPRFHAHPNLFKNIKLFFKKVFDLVGFTYALGLSTIIQDLLRFHHRKIPFFFFWKRLEKPIVSDPNNNYHSVAPPPRVSKISKHWPSGLSLLIPFFIDPIFHWSHFLLIPYPDAVDIGTILAKSHSCSLVDIDLVSKILILLYDSSSFLGARLS